MVRTVRLIRSPVSVAGMVLTTISAVVFLVVFCADLFGMHTNPYVGLIDDPLLDLVGGSVDRTIWTKGLETPDDPDGTLNPLASPLFGSLAGLPITTVYAGSMDRTAASVLALQQKVADMPGTHFTFELRKGEFHDWMIFPLPDAAAELPGMYDALGL